MGTTLENTIKLANSLKKNEQEILLNYLLKKNKPLKKEKFLNKLEEERNNVHNGKYKPMKIDEVFTHLDKL